MFGFEASGLYIDLCFMSFSCVAKGGELACALLSKVDGEMYGDPGGVLVHRLGSWRKASVATKAYLCFGSASLRTSQGPVGL